MKHKIEITIEWWENEGQDSIPETHQELLKTAAESHIYKLRKDFYTGGGLHYVADDGTQYNGNWEFREIH